MTTTTVYPVGTVIRRYSESHRHDWTLTDQHDWTGVALAWSATVCGEPFTVPAYDDVTATLLEPAHGFDRVVVRVPALLRVHQIHDDLLGWWSAWDCHLCGDGLGWFASIAEAGDHGRAHLAAHAEIGRVL